MECKKAFNACAIHSLPSFLHFLPSCTQLLFTVKQHEMVSQWDFYSLLIHDALQKAFLRNLPAGRRFWIELKNKVSLFLPPSFCLWHSFREISKFAFHPDKAAFSLLPSLLLHFLSFHQSVQRSQQVGEKQTGSGVFTLRDKIPFTVIKVKKI